jgi:oxygen-independent coproporphyrinogen-3 oxidase
MTTAPRYTSYPPVPRWGAIDPAAVASALSAIRSPAQVYVHIPFCVSQCTFCGCNMVVAGRREAGMRYLRALQTQLTGLPLPAARIPVQRIHLGGGTPTWLTPDELSVLMGILTARLVPEPGAELSVEANPHVTTPEHLDRLRELGFTRLSLGVQSLDEGVLEAVGRAPMAEKVIALLGQARRLGMETSLDLMTGLPGQDQRTLSTTLEQTIALRPERVSIFSYAHVPWLKRHQRALDGRIPEVEHRRMLRRLAREQMIAAGYVPVGFDHFSLPDDDLAVALREGRLHRNFMGYTTLGEVDLLGLGCSAISDVAGVYWQDEPKLRRWQEGCEAGEPVAVRGHVLSAEDQLRRTIINSLMCHLRVDAQELSQRYGVDLHDHFSAALSALSPMVDEGLITVSPRGLEVTEQGRARVRLIAMAFDGGGAGRYSTVD